MVYLSTASLPKLVYLSFISNLNCYAGHLSTSSLLGDISALLWYMKW